MISLLVTTSDGDVVETSSVGRDGAVGLQCGFGQRLSFARATVQIGGNFFVISAPSFELAASRSAALREVIFCYVETLWAEAQQMPLAMPFTTARHACAAGSCNAPIESAAINCC